MNINEWHEVTKKDQKRIYCVTCSTEGKDSPAEVCEHDAWVVNGRKGVSFWYYCLPHGLKHGYQAKAKAAK